MKIKTKKERISKIEITDLFIFFSIIIIFGIALIAFYPGLLTTDSVSQLNQVISGEYKNSHPLIHTIIIGNIYKIFGNVSWVAVFQILVFALTWTWGCKILRKDNDSIKNKLFQFIFTIIIAILPINFLYSITIWKDILFTYAMFGLIVWLYIGIKTDYKYSIIQLIFIDITLMLVMRLRHNGLYIGIIMFFILLTLNYIKNKNIKKTAIFIIGFIILYIITMLPQKIYSTSSTGESTSSAFNGTVVYGIGALLDAQVDIEKEDLDFLDKILTIEEWREAYNPYTGVPIHFNKNIKYPKNKEDIKRLDNIYFKYVKKYPKVIIRHFINVNSILWSPIDISGTHAVIVNNGSIAEMNNGEFVTDPLSTKLNEKLCNYVYRTLDSKIKYLIIYRPIFVIVVSIIGIIVLIKKNKNFGYIWLILPALLNDLSYIPVIASQDLRYFYPNFITCYFIILIIAVTIFKEKKIIKNSIKNIGDKTLVIVPAYNEEESIKKVVETIYEQNPTCDVVVVNDGSKDNTSEEARKTKAIVLDLPSNLGIGGAVQSGYLYAYKNDYDIAIQIDGDGQHKPIYIKQMREIISNGEADMVIGSRFVKKTAYKQTFMRMLGINITSKIIEIFTKKRIYDTTSGYRAVNKSIIKEFVESYPYDFPEPVTNMKMILQGKEIKEIPVEMEQRTTGTSFITPIKSISYMLKVTLSLVISGLIE